MAEATATFSNRTVVLGARGFIGSALVRRIEAAGAIAVGIGSRELDLAMPGATEQLASLLMPGDAVVFASCITPDRGRDLATMMRNLAMGQHAVEALARTPVAYVLYFSSDAVYGESNERIDRDTKADPDTLYGVMHLAREVMLKAGLNAPLGILRPTLVYGAGDTHNAYGPNRFRRTAEKGGSITLIGEGEEMRDHILIDDLVDLAMRMLQQRASVTLLGATGRSTSFADVARLVAAQFAPPATIQLTPRQRPVTHRRFDIGATRALFPDIDFTPIEVGIARVHVARGGG